MNQLTPYLCVADAARAIDFYRHAFGATEKFRLVEPGGRIGHAEVDFDGTILMLCEEFPELGIRKPDPRIYEHTCKLLGVEPKDCVYLDDLGINLKPAKAMGMQTIKVGSAAQPLTELEKILGIPLR